MAKGVDLVACFARSRGAGALPKSAVVRVRNLRLTFVFLFLQASQAFVVLVPRRCGLDIEIAEGDEEPEDDDLWELLCIGLFKPDRYSRNN